VARKFYENPKFAMLTAQHHWKLILPEVQIGSCALTGIQQADRIVFGSCGTRGTVLGQSSELRTQRQAVLGVRLRGQLSIKLAEYGFSKVSFGRTTGKMNFLPAMRQAYPKVSLCFLPL